MNMPVTTGPDISREEMARYARTTFGNVNEVSLASILQGRSYQTFWQSFERGPLVPFCQGCPKLFVREI
jgi:hypothetical protein